MRHPRLPPPYPPPPERSAEVRRLFGEEARSERPDLSALCLLIGAEAEVLRRRRGLPILLSVVWLEVARRAGAPVYGVALPGHFVVGFGPPEEQVLADPFDGGRVLTGADADLLVQGATGTPLEPSMLVPAAPLDVVQRILNNIRAWAAPRPERSDVGLWAVELALLLPAHPARLRYERGQLLVQRGEFTQGAEELDAYAHLIEVVDESAAHKVRQEAHSARAMLN